MAENSIKRYYPEADFVGLLPGFAINAAQVALLGGIVGGLALSTPVAEVRTFALGENTGAVVEWEGLPSAADVALIDAAVAAFTGGTTTSAPIIQLSAAVATSASATPVTKIDFTTPPLDAGTYQVIWNTSLRMQAVIANTGVQADITLTRSDLVSVHQDDAWNLTNRHAFNGVITFEVLAGQTIRSLVTFQRLGASGTAEMSGVRVSIDKIG